MDQRATTVRETETPANVTDQTRPPPVVQRRRPPPMRVVTKGWWTLEESTADIDDLRQGSEHE